MRLYNLCDSHHALLNIALRRIKISRIEDLNDPFELLSLNLRDKRVRKAFQDTKKAIHEDNGVVCFSETWQNPVMWSHYGDKHKGICLGFDIEDQLVMPVSYQQDLIKIGGTPRIAAQALTESYMTRLLSTKFQDWGYEEERRNWVRLDHSTAEGGMYFYDYSKHLKLREIILGARCDVPVARVRELAAAFPYKVHVKKARVAFTKFSVVEDRRFRG